MPLRAVASFEVTGWDQTPTAEGSDGPSHGCATVKKSFTGDLEGESTAELLMYQADTSDLGAGAGYVASERVTARLGDREGAFVMQHWGLSGGGEPPRTGGHVVPGSATGELSGLTGTVEISVDADGTHTLRMDYAFD